MVAICLISPVLQSNCNLYSIQDNVKSSYDKVKSCINDSVDENDAANVSGGRQSHKGIKIVSHIKKKGLLQWIVCTTFSNT